jgi:hypothetical protein
MPAKKEIFTINKHENIIYLDLRPTLADKTLYSSVRCSKSPLKTLISVLDAVSIQLTQVALVIDRLELLTLLLGQEDTL